MTLPSGGYPPDAANPPVTPGDPSAGSSLSEWALKTQEQWEGERNAEVQAPYDLFTTFSNVLQATVNALIQAFNGNLIPLRELVTDLTPDTPIWVDDLTDWVGQAIAYVEDVIQSIWAAVVSAFQSLGIKIRNTVGIPLPPEDHYSDPIFKPLSDEIARALNATHELAETTSSLFNIKSSRALWMGIDGSGLSSIPLIGATLGVTATEAQTCGAAIRVAEQGTVQLIRVPVKYAGTITSIHIDVYQLMPNDEEVDVSVRGAALYKYSTSDLIDELTPLAGWIDYIIPESQQYPINMGDIILVQIRCTGSGSLTVNGTVEPDITPLEHFRPRRRGWTRANVTSNPTPAVIPMAEMDNYYSRSVPYVELAMQPTDYEEAPRQFSDDFNRSTLGQKYNHYLYNTSTKLGITNGALTSGGAAAGRQADDVGPQPLSGGAYSAALYGYSLTTDYVYVKVIVQDVIYSQFGESGARIYLCSNATMANAMALYFHNDAVALQIANGVGPVSVFTTLQGVNYDFGNRKGVELGVLYDPATNVYTVILDTELIMFEFEDVNNLVKHGTGQRFYGYSNCTDVSTRGARADLLAGMDVVVSPLDSIRGRLELQTWL